MRLLYRRELTCALKQTLNMVAFSHSLTVVPFVGAYASHCFLTMWLVICLFALSTRKHLRAGAERENHKDLLSLHNLC